VIYCFDIDGTLCTNTWGDYLNAEPFQDVISQVNRLYSLGHRIILYTARGATTGIDWHKDTARQMADWKVQYHSLHMGKPGADIYVDDKAINISDWRRSNFRAELPNVTGDGFDGLPCKLDDRDGAPQ
jgi:hypothetical protein